jgi:hypothetical protein
MRTIVTALFLAALAGCQSTTPLQQVTAARQTYTATLNALTPLIANGVIADRAELRQIREIEREVPPILDQAEKEAVTGDKNVTTTLDQINAALNVLTRYLQKPRPATRPTALNQTENPWIRLRLSHSSKLALPAWTA